MQQYPDNNGPSVVFTIGNCHFLGFSTWVANFWQYDTQNDTWISMAPFPGTARALPYNFVIGSMGYVGGGNGQTSTFFTDSYAYVPPLGCSVITSIESVESSEITMQGQYLTLNVIEGSTTLQINDMLGRAVLRQPLIPGNNSIDLSAFHGVMIATIVDEHSGRISHKKIFLD